MLISPRTGSIYWRMCLHKGHLWALPSTPTSVALIWNKKLFREAGLDPEQPPRSIAELEQFNEKLARRRADGSLESIGFMPVLSGGWNALWCYWFGGALWNGSDTLTANTPENIAACKWIESYPRRFGVQALLNFQDSFGSTASAQNPFYSGRVAMVLDGVWCYNYIKNFAPADFEWGVAAFPGANPGGLKDRAIANMDALVIPAGARHPREAFEFIRYVNSQKPMEKLCLGQRKFSPLRQCSAEFYRVHPNPYVATFVTLAKSPNAFSAPPVAIWTEYSEDMSNAINRIWTGKATVEEALNEVQERQEQAYARSAARWRGVAPAVTAQWDKQ